MVLSPETIVDCDTTDNGCEGGELKNVWTYLTKEGTTTDTCKPYVSGDGTVPKCT